MKLKTMTFDKHLYHNLHIGSTLNSVCGGYLNASKASTIFYTAEITTQRHRGFFFNNFAIIAKAKPQSESMKILYKPLLLYMCAHFSSLPLKL